MKLVALYVQLIFDGLQLNIKGNVRSPLYSSQTVARLLGIKVRYLVVARPTPSPNNTFASPANVCDPELAQVGRQ